MNYHHNLRRMTALILALVLCLGLATTAFAGQEDGYHDPAEHWMISNNRTVELDVNSTVTIETFNCAECGKVTSFQVFRVPEYTRDGQTALTRNVRYSDGTLIGGDGKGATMDGTPGKDAYYTGYHWTKAVCENCGHINSNEGKSDYCYGKNIYVLYDCAAEFIEELPETVTVEYVDDAYHKITTKGGDYCVFCYGTHYHEHSELVRHSMETDIIPQLGHQRFAVVRHCTECEYAEYEFIAAKSVVADYYGVADGQPHTITVSDLSEAGVSTQIRYGNSAESCTLTSAPNYTDAGQYSVYYAITYTYKNTTMTENGVAKVWLRDESANVNGGEGCSCGCGNHDCDCGVGSCPGCNHACCASGKHNYVPLDTVQPTCIELGYARYFCVDCGKIEKRDYVNAIGHAWQSILIREATCEYGGKIMEICRNCGEVKVTETAKGEHKYMTYKIEASCTSPGYTVRECSVCGDRHITDITAAKPHTYKASVIPATCDNGGKTIHSCEGCGSSFITDYTQPLGHSWDAGTEITGVTCDGSGVTEYRCVRCGYHRLEGSDAAGHKPGPAATCTEPQICTVCGVVLELPAGHKSSDWIIDKEPTTETEGEKHIECEVCHTILERAVIEKIYLSSVTDGKGEAIVGGYLVIVTDTDSKAPVAGASVVLNKDNTLAIRLPDGRLLDYADQTTVTVLLVKDKSPVPDMFIAVSDKNDNYSAGKTDAAGQITVPAGSGYYGGPEEDYALLNGDKATYTSKGCALSENGDQYYCVITDANGKTVTSNKATLTVTAAATELKITSQPQGITVEWGDGHGPFNPVFSVAVSGGKAPYKYEWHLVDVLGGDHLCSEIPYIVADSDTLTFENFNVTAAIEAKAFYCVITDSAGKTVTSNNAYVTVSATQIYFSKQPANRSVMSGSETTFSVIVRGGTGFYGYRWYKLCDGETEALSNDGDYEGANRDTLTVKSADIWDDGAQFYCVVKDYGTEQQITSAKGSLTVY